MEGKMSPQRKFRPLKKRHVDGFTMMNTKTAKKATENDESEQEETILPGALTASVTTMSQKKAEVPSLGKKPPPSSSLIESTSVDQNMDYNSEAALSLAEKPPAKEGEKNPPALTNAIDTYVDPMPLMTAPLQRASSSQYGNDMSIPMPPLLRNTTSSNLWSTFLCANNNDSVLVGPPKLEHTTSLGQPLISDPLVHTPMDSIISSNNGYAGRQSQPAPGSRASEQSLPGIDSVFVQCAELAFRTNQLPTPNLDPSNNESEAEIASALLDLTPSLSDKKRTPLSEIHQQVAVGKKVQVAPSPSADSSITQTAANLYSIAADRSQRLFENVPITTGACKCKNTHCLKLYCACFQGGSFCDPRFCKCKQCKNNAEHSGPDGYRTRAVKMIMKRRVDAFEPRPKKTREGCSCKKSRCLKKYCDCAANGTKCTPECECNNCLNGHPNPAVHSTKTPSAATLSSTKAPASPVTDTTMVSSSSACPQTK